MAWAPLPVGCFGAHARWPGVDPLLVWADALDFIDHRRPDAPLPERIRVLVELHPGHTPAELAAAWGHGAVPLAYTDAKLHPPPRYCTAWLTADQCRSLLSGPHPLVARFDMQMPVIPQRPVPESAPVQVQGAGALSQKAGEVLLGVIDDGCAFAHASLRRGAGTKVLALWDQDPAPAFASGPAPGNRPWAFGYGCEVDRHRLNHLIDRHRHAGGLDENGCYASANYRRLRQRVVHGSAVTDLLCGPQQLDGRLGGCCRRDPPSPVSKYDLAFVQVARDAVRDTSSGPLAALVLDGLHYIVGCASKDTRRIVVNASMGSFRGAHDGTALLERAMVELVQAQRTQFDRELSIVLPAGNTFDDLCHAQTPPLKAGETAEVCLRLPADCETPTYVSIRIPLGAHGVRLSLTPPWSDAAAHAWVDPGDALGWQTHGHVGAGIVYSKPGHGVAGEALLCFRPTRVQRGQGEPAVPGLWHIAVQSAHALPEPVHLYVARNAAAPGTAARGRQARLVDLDGRYDPMRQWRKAESDPSAPASPIRRQGTLNGLATGVPGQGVFVIGSQRISDHRPSLYSSAGPAVGTGPLCRQAPDAFAPGDVSRALPGIRAAGGRSGEINRMIGTSFASPQVARCIAEKGTSAVADKALRARQPRPGPR